MSSIETKVWSNPDYAMTPNKTHAATIKFGLVNITKANKQPGWKWSECIKSHIGTYLCQDGHIGVLMQGNIHVVGDDGSEEAISAGSAYKIVPGHDAWVVGDEPALGIEFSTTEKEFAAWAKG